MEATERRLSGTQRDGSTSRGGPAAPGGGAISVSSGTRLADFDIDYRLGKGAYGVVHRAKRKQDGKLYVIKTIPIGELGEEEKHEAVNEVMLLASINSPYVVKYYDSFMENDELHIVMEYCNRGDLQRIIRKLIRDNCRNVAEEKIWSIFIQVALGLYYLHSRAILHRDMKAANVFIHKDEFTGVQSVKIGDLGVAKLLDSNTAFATTLVGTPYYLSPELCQNKRYNERSDVWSLGVLLYQCCTLKLPFEANNPYVLMCKIIKGKYEPISSRYLSQELVGLVRQLLTPDSDVRPSLKQILGLRFVQERCLQLGLELPTDIPLAAIPINPSSSSTGTSQPLPALSPLATSTRKLPQIEEAATAAGGGTTPRPISSTDVSAPVIMTTSPATPAAGGGVARTPRGSAKGISVPPPVSTAAVQRALSPGESSSSSLLSPGGPVSPSGSRQSYSAMQARSGGGLKSPGKVLTSSSWMPNPFKRSGTVNGSQRLDAGEGGTFSSGGREQSDSEVSSMAVPVSPAGINSPLSPSGASDALRKAPRSARGYGRPLYSVKDLKSATRKDLMSAEGGGGTLDGDGGDGGSGAAEGGRMARPIASGYKAMANNGTRGGHGADDEDWSSTTMGGGGGMMGGDTTRSLEALEEANSRGAQAGGGGRASGGGGVAMERYQPVAREELERKCKDMEDLIQRTRAQCMEGLSEEAFADIYRFFTTNVTASRDNALNDVQLAELEQIIMTACANNVQKSYVVLFNVQKLLAQEERLREIRSLLADLRKPSAAGGGLMVDPTSARRESVGDGGAPMTGRATDASSSSYGVMGSSSSSVQSLAMEKLGSTASLMLSPHAASTTGRMSAER